MKNFLTDNLFTYSLAQPSYSYMADGGMMAKGGGVGDLRAGNIYSKKMPYYYKGEITDYTIQPIVVDMLDDEYVYYSNYQLARTAEKMDIKEFKRQLEDGSIKPYHIKDLRGEITYLVDGRLNTFLNVLYFDNLIDCILFTNQEFEKIKARFNYERHKVKLGAGRRGFTGEYTDNIYVNIKRNDWTNTRFISITKITNSDKLNEHFNKIKVAEQDSRGRDTYFIYDTVDDFVKNHETNMEMGGRVGKYADGDMMAEGGMVARTILSQLGGANKLFMMTGAYNFIDLGNGLSFKLKNQRANFVKITLNGKDLYDVEVGRIRGNTYKKVKSADDLYYDQLKAFIEQATGMYLSFATGGTVPNLGSAVIIINNIDEYDGYVQGTTLTVEGIDDMGYLHLEDKRGNLYFVKSDDVKTVPKKTNNYE